MARTKFLDAPPPTAAGRYQRKPDPAHVEMVRKMKRKPGEWILVRSYTTRSGAAGFADKVKNSKPIAFKDGRFEAKTRGNDVYARFTG